MAVMLLVVAAVKLKRIKRKTIRRVITTPIVHIEFPAIPEV
jgi:hypothetical protein